MFKTLKALEKEVSKLEKSFGLCKVRLIHEDGSGEGIWAVPADAESKARLDNDKSQDEFAFVRLCNMPLGWNNLNWGGLVRVKTNGEIRADGHLEEQDLPQIRNDQQNVSTLVLEELAKKDKKTTKSKK